MWGIRRFYARTDCRAPRVHDDSWTEPPGVRRGSDWLLRLERGVGVSEINVGVVVGGNLRGDAEAAGRKPYATPMLVNYGRVADLTAGGSVSTNEEHSGRYTHK